MSSLGYLYISFQPTEEVHTDYFLCQLRLPSISDRMLPFLRVLDVPFFCLPSFSVKSLHEMTISHSPTYGDPTRREIEALPLVYDALERCPDLVTLRMNLITGIRSEAPHPLRTINLPRLRHLELRESFARCRLLISALNVSATVCLELDGRTWPDGGLTSVLALRPFEADRVCIWHYRSTNYDINCYVHDELRLGARVQYLDEASLADVFARAPGAGITTFECTVLNFDGPINTNWDGFDLPELLPGFPWVTHLIARGVLAVALFKALSGGGLDDPTSQSAPIALLCPALKDVIYGWESHETGLNGLPVRSLCNVVNTIVPHLVRRAELGGKRLEHLVLERYLRTDGDEDTFHDVTESAIHINDVLAPLRGLVDGSVEYKEIEGAIGW